MKTPIECATQIIDDLAITRAPVPLEKVARHIDAEIRYSPLDDELSGMAVVKDGNAIIGVNAMHHPNRQRFTIAHECGHLVMHKKILLDSVHVDREFKLMRNENSTTGLDKLEREANLFASELLMPEKLLVLALQGRGVDIETEDGVVTELAKKFRVSIGAMKLRLGRLFNT